MKKQLLYLYKNHDTHHVLGPVEESDLQKLYLEELLHLDDLVYKEGSHWKLVRDNLDLFHKTPEVSFFQKKYFLYFIFFIFFSTLLYLALS